MPRPAILLLLPGLALAGCQPAARPAVNRPVVAVEVEEIEPWRRTATDAGVSAINGLADRWTEALANARRRGGGRVITAEGELLDPAAALARAAPGPGPYRCRLFRVAAPGARVRGIAPARSGFCFIGVEDDQLSLTSEIPGHRLGGYLYETKSSAGLVFLGAAAAVRGRSASGYGEDPARDLAGRFERVGEFRYRLVLPAATPPELQVLELIPAPAP
jgi:hypothetical protein